MYSRFQSIGSIQSHVEIACGECAYDDYAEENFPKEFARAKRSGARDVAGSVADMLFNDASMIKDLVGDAFYEWSSGKTPEEKKEGAERLGKCFPQAPGLAGWLLKV